jgi:hypothetical protein
MFLLINEFINPFMGLTKNPPSNLNLPEKGSKGFVGGKHPKSLPPRLNGESREGKEEGRPSLYKLFYYGLSRMELPE